MLSGVATMNANGRNIKKDELDKTVTVSLKFIFTCLRRSPDKTGHLADLDWSSPWSSELFADDLLK